MKSALRLLVCFAVLSGLTTGVLALQPVWLKSMGLDVWSLPALQDEISQGMDRNDDLDRQSQVIKQRLEIKETAIQDWARGRIGLPEAVERFRVSNDIAVQGGDYWRKLYPSETEDQALCKQFLTWAETELRHLKGIDVTAVRARLEAESREYLKSH